MQTRQALIVGCGYLGEAVADRLHAAGWLVTGWTGSAASAQRLAAEKAYRVEARDLGDRETVRRAGLPAEVVIDCVSSGRGGAEVYRRVYLDGARHLLEAFPGARLVFTGSTSVYGQMDGEWVDEASPAQPPRETGRVLLETEDVVLAAGGTVARLSGIYGPGRNRLWEKFLAGEAVIEGDGGRWLNHIHRDDAAEALVRLAGAETPGGIYNVSDDAPVTQLGLYEAWAKGEGRPLPPVGPPDLERKRGWTSKRVRNQRMRALGWAPRHACFVAGARSLST